MAKMSHLDLFLISSLGVIEAPVAETCYEILVSSQDFRELPSRRVIYRERTSPYPPPLTLTTAAYIHPTKPINLKCPTSTTTASLTGLFKLHSMP
jgi:hypothetical protein